MYMYDENNKLTPEILPLAVPEEPHALVQPRQVPRLAAHDGPLARHFGLVLQTANLRRHRALDPRPDAFDEIHVVPHDTAAMPRVRQHGLLVRSDADRGWFPGAVALGFGGADEGVAFVLREDVVQDCGVEVFVFG